MNPLFLKKITSYCHKSNLEPKNKKMKIYKNLFSYIRDNKHNLLYYKKMKRIIRKKLIEFYVLNDLKQAKVWYKWIFDNEIPIDY